MTAHFRVAKEGRVAQGQSAWLMSDASRIASAKYSKRHQAECSTRLKVRSIGVHNVELVTLILGVLRGQRRWPARGEPATSITSCSSRFRRSNRRLDCRLLAEGTLAETMPSTPRTLGTGRLRVGRPRFSRSLGTPHSDPVRTRIPPEMLPWHWLPPGWAR